MSLKNLICGHCSCFLPSQDHNLQHDNQRHTLMEDQTMKKYNNENVLHDVNNKINNEEAGIDLVDSQYVKQTKQIKPNTIEVNNEQLNIITRKCKSCSSSLCNKTCIRTVEQKLLENKIIINEFNDFSCTTCNRNIKSLHDILIHIKGKRHKNMLKTYNACFNIYKDGTNEKQIIAVNCSNNAMRKQIFFTKNQSSPNNIVKIETQVSEVAVNDKDFNNDFIITKDVSAQIASSLSVSPLNKKTLKEYKPKENLSKRLNKAYTTKYLKIENKIYTVEQKLNYIEANLRLIMPYDIKYFYCLACNEKVSKELYSLYEHICLQLHMVQVNEIKKNIKSEKLLSQYMTEKSKDWVKCFPCGNSLCNDIQSIEIHIKNGMHKQKYKMFVKVIDTAFNSISQDINNLWYSIQRFCCVLCEQNFKYKIKFIEHIAKTHTQLLKHQIYDFCIPCTTLWLGKKNSYTEHCSDIVHRYLIRSQDFMIEDLPDNIIQILTQVDEVSDNLFQQTQLLLNGNIHWEVKQSLENSLKLNFPTVKTFVFGSRITGLGFPDSDIDIFVDCGNRYNQNENENFEKKHLTSIKNILYLYKEEWEVKEIVEDARVPIIKLVYKRIGLNCDISVTNGLSVENSKLIRSFNDAYLPCRKLILFVKKWLSQFNLPNRHGLSNYALAWLVIFYLQSKSYLPSVARLIKEENNSKLLCGWEIGVAKPKNNTKSEQSIRTLLIGFFQFYANFDYRHYVVCPLMGYSLTKQAFAEPQTLPTEMKPYITHLNKFKNPEYFRIDSPLCVQDPFVLSYNLTRSVSNITLKYFKQYCQDSASILLCPTK